MDAQDTEESGNVLFISNCSARFSEIRLRVSKTGSLYKTRPSAAYISFFHDSIPMKFCQNEDIVSFYINAKYERER